MYILPNSNLHILRNVPLDTGYEHTIYFANPTAQYTYFNSLAKFRRQKYSYLRPNENVIRVDILSDDLYDCNYIMFQNTSFGNRWFYAYIRSVNMVNNKTSEITFDLDVIQTWFFDFTLDTCFVERTHTQTDVIGEHIEPESVEVGEYVMNSYEEITSLTKMDVIVGICDVDEGADGRVYDGIFSGAQLWAFKDTDFTGINDKINRYAQNPDAVTIMYICPNRLIYGDDGDPPDGGILIPYTVMGREFTYTPANGSVKPTDFLDGYKPRNNKMYTYPYCYYHVDNGNGSNLALRYEFFTGGQVKVKIGGTIVQPVQVILNPMNYKAWQGAAGMVNKNETLSLNNYPMCSWNMDSYKAWVAQNSVPMAINTVTGGLGMIAQMASGNLVGGALSGVNMIGNLLSQNYQASIAADIHKGSANSANVNVSLRELTFWGGRASITAEYAKCIDDYFTLYGYGVKRLMKPVLNARPHWTYIKTVDATITGSVPCDDMKRIIEIFDSGITVWMHGAEVGHYELNNSPVAG